MDETEVVEWLQDIIEIAKNKKDVSIGLFSYMSFRLHATFYKLSAIAGTGVVLAFEDGTEFRLKIERTK